MTLKQPPFMLIVAALALGWAATVVADDQKFPATGQTASLRPGDDGDIQAGATLSYKDNGNGTITDRNTRLVWEKQSDDGSIHDWGNGYTWDNAFDVHIFTLNNTCAKNEHVDCSTDAGCASVGGKCGFTGKRDWRLPNYKELTSILNLDNSRPAVSAAFHNDNTCVPGATVLTGSCTAQGGYWSSTSFGNSPITAWIVDFYKGFVNPEQKDVNVLVRAVRSGSL